jgi:predicted TIM-barrel fold metal-dependent hydrolase
VIIDFHTHIFPPDVRDNRKAYLRRDPAFGEMYSSPKAKIATAEDLLLSMDGAGVDASVALGFAWREQELIARHNEYLLEASAKSGGRIIPFCAINPSLPDAEVEARRCADGGARGFGELRPDSQGWDPNGPAGDRLAAFAASSGMLLLFHVTEPVGHDYPGKSGGALRAFYEFARKHPEARIIGAHLAGGLPFYMPMARVQDAFANLWVDTAAQPLLYGRSVYRQLGGVIERERLLFGSDIPLVEQSRQMGEIRDAFQVSGRAAQALGGAAARLLGIRDESG